jgi:hypothetical protein
MATHNSFWLAGLYIAVLMYKEQSTRNHGNAIINSVSLLTTMATPHCKNTSFSLQRKVYSLTLTYLSYY